jgi:hypothetical protein
MYDNKFSDTMGRPQEQLGIAAVPISGHGFEFRREDGAHLTDRVS